MPVEAFILAGVCLVMIAAGPWSLLFIILGGFILNRFYLYRQNERNKNANTRKL